MDSAFVIFVTAIKLTLESAKCSFGKLLVSIEANTRLAAKKLLVFCITLLCTSISSTTFAANEIGNARVKIVPAIQIDEETEVDFGLLSNIDGTCFMAADGSLSGSAGMDCIGNETPGVFSIRGASGAVINISATQGTIGGVTFNPVIAGNINRTLNDGSTTVTILGNLVLNGATEGTKVITYTLVANYE